MSRINEPVSFHAKIILQTACYKKHTADAGASVLIPYLTKNTIDFATDVADGVAAVAFDVSATSLAGQSEKATEDRDQSFEPVWKDTLAWAQFLKKLFKGNVKELTDWGVPVDVNGKINYPAPFTERADISVAMIAKSNSYPDGTSPLQVYITNNNNNLTTISAAITSALAFDISRAELKTASVKATQDRDEKFAKPYINLKGIGSYLMTLFPDSPKNVALWGFDEVDTVVAESERTVTLLPLRSKLISGIVLGSVLTNTGLKDIVIAAGKKGLGKKTTVSPTGTMGMNKGYSAMVASNPATIGNAMFTVSTK